MTDIEDRFIFPRIVAHMGQCGTVTSQPFTKNDAYNKELWQIVAEKLRQKVLAVESAYQKENSTIFRKDND